MFPISLFAQENSGKDVQFKMIKAAISFLATDTISFEQSSQKPANCTDYDCLAKYCRDNKLTNAEPLVDSWKVVPITSELDLESLKDGIIKKLTTGSSKKEKRKNLPGYKDFESNLNNLVNSFKETDDVGNGESQTSAGNGTDLKPQRTDPDTESPLSTISEETKPQSGSMLPTIAFLVSLTALVVGLFAFTRGKKDAEKNKQINVGNTAIMEEIKAIKARITQNQSDSQKPLQNRISSLEDRVSDLESRIRNMKMEANIVSTTSNLEFEKPSSSTAAINTQNNAFAKLPDLGNGFSSVILAKEQNGEQIYEIEITGDNAIFTITEDKYAQKYALSDPNYYLSSACDFYNQPVKGANIKVIENGTLTKSGSNWIIQSKAKIEFR